MRSVTFVYWFDTQSFTDPTEAAEFLAEAESLEGPQVPAGRAPRGGRPQAEAARDEHGMTYAVWLAATAASRP